MSNETAADLLSLQFILIGLCLGCIAYGVHITLTFAFFKAFFILPLKHTKLGYVMMGYVSVIFILGGIANGASIRLALVVLVNKSSYQGDLYAYWSTAFSDSVTIIRNTAYLINNLFQEGLLVYRFWVLSRKVFTILPLLMFLVCIGLACTLITELCMPGQTLWTDKIQDLGISFWSISIALNISLTLCIVGRLLYMRHQLRQFGDRSCDALYMSISRLLVESAAITSVSGILFLVTYATNSPLQHLALPVFGQIQSIGPLLILRVAQERARSVDNVSLSATSTLRFDYPGPPEEPKANASVYNKNVLAFIATTSTVNIGHHTLESPRLISNGVSPIIDYKKTFV